MTRFEDKTFDGISFAKAWKGHDWNALNRLHEKGYIADPKNKNKSVTLTTEGNNLSAAF